MAKRKNTKGQTTIYQTYNTMAKRKSTKGQTTIYKRKHNGQKKKDKRTNNDLQNIHIKLKIELHVPH